MSTPWFFRDPLHVGEVSLDPEESRHALASHRLHAGDELILFDGRGSVARARLLPADAKLARRRQPISARTEISAISAVPHPRRRLSLVVSGCKGPRLSWMIEKCTELGVTAILLTAFERSVVDPSDSRVEKLQRIALEACKQARRAWLPTIECGVSLSNALKYAPVARLYLADASPAALPAAEVLATKPPPAAEPSAPDAPPQIVVIGPEGGLSAREADQCVAAGARPIRLAAQILRVETAAIAAAAVWASAE